MTRLVYGLLALVYQYVHVDATICMYNFWRLTVSTVSSAGYETYISEIELYDNNTKINEVYDIKSNAITSNLIYCFDNNTVSISRFPYTDFPEPGHYIQWRCEPACYIDSIRITQSTGQNNIPEWKVQYSDCGQNFTTKWLATTTTATSTSRAPAYTASEKCYFDLGNCSSSDLSHNSSTTTTSLLIVIVALLGTLLVVVVGFGVTSFVGSGKRRDQLSSQVFPNHDIENQDVIQKLGVQISTITPHQSASDKPVPQRYHSFLSHDWGARSANHCKVKLIHGKLCSLGIKSWFDEERISGNIVAKMAAGIDSSDCVVVFITSNYIAKVNGHDERDSCKLEFQYAFNHLGPQRMIPVVMEPELLEAKKWEGVLGAALSSRLYVDMTGDLEDMEILQSKAKHLHRQILELVES